jgi:putative ABC transport system permease protein
MRVVGVLAPSGSPDDSAIFVDVKTAWVIEGLGHGHQDLARPESSALLLSQEGNRLTANAAVAEYNEITPDNADSFHFHGDVAEFPITAVVAVPRDQKSMTLLMGRYQSEDDRSQIVRPSMVMDSLLATILKVRSFMLAGSLLVGLAAVLTAVLVFVLSLRLREREIATMAKIGCARYKLASMLLCEVLVVIVAGGAVAAAMAAATSHFGMQAIRWFLL